LILADGGSTDETQQILASYGVRLRSITTSIWLTGSAFRFQATLYRPLHDALSFVPTEPQRRATAF